jgi:hypothetical protein
MYPLQDVERSISKMYEFHDLYNVEGLYPHQEFVRRFMSPHTPYKSILLYHSPGSGKSMICISIAVDHYKALSMKALVVTKGESSSDSFKKQIEQYMNMSLLETKPSSIFNIDHYISLHNKIVKCSDRDVVSMFDNKIIIFDEIHNIRELGSKFQSSFKSLLRIKELCTNSKFILSTATPMVDNFGQMESVEKLISTNIGSFISFNSRVQMKPRTKYMGNTEYDHIVERLEVCHMMGHQKERYEMEDSGVVTDLYKKLTHLALFSFPKDDVFLEYEKIKSLVSPLNRSKSLREMSFIHFSIMDEYTKYLSGDFLRSSSCKYHRLMQNIRKSKGNIFVSLEEVRGSGLILLSKILEAHGYELYYGQPINVKEKRDRYTICVGSTEICPNMQERLDAFNSDSNINGSCIKILLGSRVIGESITLLNVRQFHSLSPHWNYSKLTQAIGRVVRSNSHSRLHRKDREVEIYVYVTADSIDEYKMRICQEKQRYIEIQEEALKNNSIERYIKDEEDNIPELNTDNFLLYYTDKYYNLIESQIEKVFFGYSEIRFEDICSKLDFPRTVVIDILFKVVVNNRRILGDKYLREDNSIFFLTEDPSSPFCKIRPHVRIEEEPGLILEKEIDLDLSFENDTDALSFLRTKSVKEKIELLEELLKLNTHSESQGMIVNLLGYLFVNLDGILYHILYYRELSNAYKAVIPFHDVLSGKTRKLVESEWVKVEDISEEEEVINVMRERYYSDIRGITDTYAIISVIDNIMRLRRSEEMKDRRKTLKGRTLKSMKKDDLLNLCENLELDADITCKAKDLMKEIENLFIQSGNYVLI